MMARLYNKNLVTLLPSRLSLAAAISVPLGGFAMPAQAKVIDVQIAPSNARCDGPIHIPIVEVEGKARGAYGNVSSRELWACLQVTGSAPDYSRNGVDGYLRIESRERDIPAAADRRYYAMAFAYTGPLSEGGAYRQSPVELCNEHGARLRGRAKERFIEGGDMLLVENAYFVKATATWEIRRSRNPLNPNFHRFSHEKWEDQAQIPARIHCKPTGHFARTSSSTSTNSTLPPGTVPTSRQSGSEPTRTNPPRRTNPPARTNPAVRTSGELLKTFKLDLAEMGSVDVGAWQCPNQIRLRGRIDVNRAFTGETSFVGPNWSSTPTPVAFANAGGRYVTAQYPLDWSEEIAGEALDQDIQLRFILRDAGGQEVATARTAIAITCTRKTGAGLLRR